MCVRDGEPEYKATDRAMSDGAMCIGASTAELRVRDGGKEQMIANITVKFVLFQPYVHLHLISHQNKNICPNFPGFTDCIGRSFIQHNEHSPTLHGLPRDNNILSIGNGGDTTSFYIDLSFGTAIPDPRTGRMNNLSLQRSFKNNDLKISTYETDNQLMGKKIPISRVIPRNISVSPISSQIKHV